MTCAPCERDDHGIFHGAFDDCGCECRDMDDPAGVNSQLNTTGAGRAQDPAVQVAPVPDCAALSMSPGGPSPLASQGEGGNTPAAAAPDGTAGGPDGQPSPNPAAVAGPSGIDAWKRALSDHNAAKRRGRFKRAPKGYRPGMGRVLPPGAPGGGAA